MATAAQPMSALEQLANTPDPQAQTGGTSALEQLANGSGQASQAPRSPLMQAVRGEDTNIPLTSQGAATEQGLLNIVQGASQGVQGAYNLVRHPIDTAKGIAAVPSQAAQVPGAIRDINQSADPTGTYLQVAGKTAGQGAGQALAAIATEGLAKGVKVGAAKTVAAIKNVTGLPAALSADTSSTLAEIAHNEGLDPITSTTARDAAQELQDSFLKRAKSQYGIVDKAVDGDLKPVQERIQSLKKAIRAQSNVNPDLADKYIDELGRQQKTLQDLVARAKANGVANADQIMDAADKDYARSMAMKKVTAGFKTASGEVKMGGHPNPQSFAAQVDRLNNVGTLQRALGEDGANAIKSVAKQGLTKAKNVALAKKVAGRAALAGGGALAYEGVRHALTE